MDSTENRRDFIILSTTALLNIAFLVSYAFSANWWESAGIPILLGLPLVTGILGGKREYGFLYTIIPAYLFLLPIIQWVYVMSDFGAGQEIRKIFILFLIPLVISLPIVAIGYLIGVGIHILLKGRH